MSDDNLLMRVEGETAAIDEVMLATVQAAFDEDLVFRCVDLRVAGLVRWDAIHRRLNLGIEHEDEKVAAETVQACLKSTEFTEAWRQAREDPEGWLQRRLRRVQQIHRLLDGVDELAAPTNKDKRTRTANLQHRLGIAGITPQTQVAVGPDQNFMDFIGKMMTKKGDDAAR